MTKRERLIVSAGAMTGGLLLCGFAMTTKLEDPVPAAGIIFGLAFAAGGFISLILGLKKR